MALNSNKVVNVLGLDVGDVRIGVARANSVAMIPSPIGIFKNDETFVGRINNIIKTENIDRVVIGLPRDMKGEESQQAKIIRQFAYDLEQKINKSIELADETLSSHRAESEHKYRSNSSSKHQDDVAACYILEEYFGQ